MLQIAEESLLQHERTHDDVIGRSGRADQHERAADRRDGGGGAIRLGGTVVWRADEPGQRPAEHLAPGRSDHEGAVEGLILSQAVEPVLERNRAPGTECLGRLAVKLLALNPRPLVAVLQGNVDRDGHGADENQRQRQPE